MLGITGASGAAYALRLLDELLVLGTEVHLVVTEYGKRLLAEEAGLTAVTQGTVLECVAAMRARGAGDRGNGACGEGERDGCVGELVERLFIHPNKDVGATIASGSFLHDGMVVMPCSSTSLGAMASGAGSNLLTRAALVTLKERRPLIVGHRETPLSLIDIENYRALTLAGAVICPTNPGFYLRPEGVEDLVDFMVGKVLDLLRIEHGLATRYRAEGEGTGRVASKDAEKKERTGGTPIPLDL